MFGSPVDREKSTVLILDDGSGRCVATSLVIALLSAP
jgi:hypothetical protein